MKRLLWAVVFAATSAVAAEETFSRTVPTSEFSAAGLAKLTPAELARLDALVRDFKSGALEAARQATETANARAATAERDAETARATARQAASAPARSEPGIFSKAKVMLTPGTTVEYEAVMSHIAGEFRGWESRTVFTLENGQRWKLANSSSYYSPAITRPAVSIVPAAIGGYWMTIEGVAQKVKVLPLISGK